MTPRSRIGRRERDRQIQKQLNAQPSPTKKRGFPKALEIGIAVAGLIIGAVSLALAVKADPSISMEQPLNPDKVLTTPFVISNNGSLSLESVRVAILIKGFKDSANNSLDIGSTDWTVSTVSREMKPGDRKTISAPFNRFFDTSYPVVAGQYGLIVSFTPAYWPFWEKRRAFLFTIARQSDGRSRFEQQPAQGIEEEYRRHTPFMTNIPQR